MTLPTRQDINTHDSLDERLACVHFLGKSLLEAEALFKENSLYYQEDLMCMGARAFRFYAQAVISYVQSDASTGDSDIAICFAGILEHRMEYESDELRPIASRLAGICRYIMEHYDRFGLTSESYGDVRPRFQALQRALLRQAGSESDEHPG